VSSKGKADFINSYLISHKIGNDKIRKIAEALTNPILEEFSINTFPKNRLRGKFTYAIEIGFKPGVTDNVGHTVKESINDLLRLKNNLNLEVYTSRVFLISGALKRKNVAKIASLLHNPLIESFYIASAQEVRKGLLLKAPIVILKKNIPVIKVPLLNLSEEKLIKIGRDGILDPSGTCRGPLALDLPSMKAIEVIIKN